MAEKARYWTWVGYPESMIDNWEDRIEEILQYPYVYCIHDRDTLDEDEEKRKTHVHIMIAYGNTTTMSNIRNVFSKLRKNQDKEKVFVQSVQNVKYLYNYLIHDTDNARKKNKYQYAPEDRITGNDFDIGMYEQISVRDKQKALKELLILIQRKNFMDFSELTDFVLENLDDLSFDVLISNSGFIERYFRGRFCRKQREKGLFYRSTTTDKKG